MEKQSYELISNMIAHPQVEKVHTIIIGENESKIRFFIGLKRRIKNLLKKEPGISIIHFNDGLAAAICHWIKELTDVPVVTTIHGLDIVFPWKYFQKKIVPKLHKHDAIIGVSQATADQCISRGFDAERVYAVKNGIDHDLADVQVTEDFIDTFEKKYNISIQGKKIIVTMGRPVKRKGFSWFVKHVMPAVDKDVLFLMIGPRGKITPLKKALLSILPSRTKHLIELFFGMSSDEVPLRKLLSDSRYNRNTIELGKMPFKEILQLLSVSNLFVMPNISVEGDTEGFGLVALESTIRSTPVLASGIEGITDAIQDGKNGYLIESQNPDAWIQKINTLLSDIEQLDRFGKEAKDYTINSFGWEKMVDAYYDVFKKVAVDK